jgi:uncharacterized protein (TIGR02246 family)
MPDDTQAIRDLISTWMEASMAGDLPKILSLMSSDVIFLTPGNPPMRGRDAFAASYQSMQGKVRIDGKADIQEVQLLGDWAFCWTNLRVTITPLPSGEPMTRAGHTLSILRKESGGWVLYRDANLLAPFPKQ